MFDKSLLLTFNRVSEDHRGTPEAPGRVVTLIEVSTGATYSTDTHNRSIEGNIYIHMEEYMPDEIMKQWKS